jgi:hypothetical protein
MITQTRLKELHHYDPNTGIFTNIRLGSASGTILKKDNGKSYRRIKIDDQIYGAHRLAWLYVHGDMPKHEIDHKDGCGTNNAISNLRCSTRRDNSKNRRLDNRNKTGFNGVCWRESKQRYYVQITVDRKQIHLGAFVGLEDAIKAREKANKEYGFHSGHGKDRPL